MDNTINLSYFEIFKYLISKPIGQGDFGKVYRYNKEYVIKLWKDKDYADKNTILNSLNYDSIISPDKFVAFDGRIIGYIMKYFKGKTLDKIENANFINFILALSILRKDIYAASKEKYLFCDCSLKNLMYNENRFMGRLKIIDTDKWSKSTKSADYCLAYNLQLLNNAILSSFDFDLDNTLKAFILNNPNLEALNEFRCGYKDIRLYLSTIKRELEKYTNKKITTMKDFNRVLKKR